MLLHHYIQPDGLHSNPFVLRVCMDCCSEVADERLCRSGGMPRPVFPAAQAQQRETAEPGRGVPAARRPRAGGPDRARQGARAACAARQRRRRAPRWPCALAAGAPLLACTADACALQDLASDCTSGLSGRGAGRAARPLASGRLVPWHARHCCSWGACSWPAAGALVAS